MVAAYLASQGFFPTIPAAENLAEVGAAFGAAGAVVSVLAFAAVVASLVGQWRALAGQMNDLQEQKKLLADQTWTLKVASAAQTRAAESLQGQLDHMSRRAKLDDYDRRLDRFVDAQRALDDDVSAVELTSEMDHRDARDRLGNRYWSALTNLTHALSRIQEDAALADEFEDLKTELKAVTATEAKLLYLALVPSRVPPNYKPSKLGRSWASYQLAPFVETRDDPQGRALTFRNHFLPLVRNGKSRGS